LVSLAACGNRHTDAELLDAARGGSAGVAAQATGGLDTGTATSPGAAAGASAGSGTGGSAQVAAGAAQGTARSGPAAAGAHGGPTSSCAKTCSPLVIASVGTYSGIVGQNVGGGARALQAWATTVNAAGGVHGHRVEALVLDDGGNPARHRALLQEAVDKHGAVAFVYNAAPLSGQASVDYVTSKKIPVIGSEAAGEWFYQSPYFFPQSTSGKLLVATGLGAAVQTAGPGGPKKVGFLYCSDGIAICDQARQYGPGFARQFGLDPVYSGSGSLAQPDFTANCLAARDAGAELLSVAMDGNSAQRIARSCHNVGYQPKIVLNQQIEFSTVAADPNLDGSYGTALNAPWFDSANPAVAEFQRAMAQQAPGVDIAGSPMQGWASAKLLEAAAANLSEPPTSESILNGLWALKDETLGGLAMPLTFNKGAIAPRPVCWWALIIAKGTYANSGDGKVRCRNDIK
jgi:branched-chain amino acid transport system substrate-binding protein